MGNDLIKEVSGKLDSNDVLTLLKTLFTKKQINDAFESQLRSMVLNQSKEWKDNVIKKLEADPKTTNLLPIFRNLANMPTPVIKSTTKNKRN